MPGGLQAWYRDEVEDNYEDLHQTVPPHMLTVEDMLRLTGVRYMKVENYNDEEQQRKLAEGYIKADFADICPESMGDEYEEKVKIYHTEHLHADPEIRMVVAGGGFFEVRAIDNRWVRIHLQEGDLLSLPAGIYHRFHLDSRKHMKVFRLFSEEPKWEAIFLPEAETHPARARYMEAMATIKGSA